MRIEQMEYRDEPRRMNALVRRTAVRITDNLPLSRTDKSVRPPGRLGRTGIRACHFAMLMLMLTAGAGWAQPNQPPQRIWHKDARVYNEAPRTDNFYDWTWIGDQNGDGCDELLISQEPLTRGEGQVDPLNRVEIYLGDRNEISQEPAFTFETNDSLESMGLSVAYLGALTGRDAHDFAVTTAIYRPDQEGGGMRESYTIEIYRGGSGRFDTEPDFVIRRAVQNHWRQRGRIRLRNTVSPFDINGDSYNDLFVRSQDTTTGVYFSEIYFGGEEFDTDPDFATQMLSEDLATLETGSGDFNGDSYDDLFVREGQGNELTFMFGSDRLTEDSIRVLSFDSMEGFVFGNAVYPCPDVNGDSCDDWVMQGLQNFEDPFSMTVLLFLGGETLDTEPDRTLRIDPFPVYGGGSNHGGNSNGDRFGDIITRQIDTRYFFGSSWVNESPGLVFNAAFNETQGAYGDFNGDRVNDCVFRSIAEHGEYHYLEIYANDPDWVVSVGDEGPFPIPKEFTVSAHPNPFNNLTVVTFDLPDKGDLRYELFDTNGRSISAFERKIFAPGAQSVVVSGEGLPSGGYYLKAKLQSSTGQYVTNLKLTHIN